MAVYVCSDIHGQYDLFLKMLSAIHFSDDDLLYIAGDLIDRGPDSMGLILDVMKRKNVISLIGNHELMMYDHLHQIRSNRRCDIWMYDCNGGRETKRIYEQLSEDERTSVMNFINDLYLQVEVEVNDTVFLISHSSFLQSKGTIKWKDVLWNEDVYDCVWSSPWRTREYMPVDLYRDGRYHVIGHVPVPILLNVSAFPGTNIPYYVNDRCGIVNIDYGCARMEYEDEDPARYALCCLNLCDFSANHTSGFTFIRGGEENSVYTIG